MSPEFEHIRMAMDKAADGNVFASAVLVVGLEGQLLLQHVAGYAWLEPEKLPATEDTVYDLASLTKPIVISTIIALMVDAGEIAITDSVDRYVSFPDNNGVRIEHLLTHSSGLPGWKPFYRWISAAPGSMEAKKQVREAVRATPVMAAPGERVRYSDLGFIILEEIIETVTGEKLNRLADRLLFKKAGMKHSFFVPENRPDEIDSCGSGETVFAATTYSSILQQYHIGTVSDENCFAMGGVSGHAGLFATGKDVFIFTTELLKALAGRSGLFPGKVITEFTQRSQVAPEWGLGWDKPSVNSSSGNHFDADAAFGHLGFSGSSVWVDPIKHISITLLTNRVHPTTMNTKIREFRPYIHNMVMETVFPSGLK